MSNRILFDNNKNPILPTLVLAKRDGTKLGVIPFSGFKIIANMNSNYELSFNVDKLQNGKTNPLWDSIKDFKLVWLKEWDLWFEVSVELHEEISIYKTVNAKSLAECELSQINLYNIEINTENDIMRDDYEPTVLYNALNPETSLFHRILSKAPHYSVTSVAHQLQNIQRTFSFNNTSVYSALQTVAEEIDFYIDFSVHSDENGKPNRTFKVYDLESYCNDCNTRGEFTKVCSKCNSENITRGFGNDSRIFVSTKNLADSIAYKMNSDSVKNCFKLETGDDLMTATVASCNPNGSQYIWYISDELKSDMPDELTQKLNDYNIAQDEIETNHRFYTQNSELYNSLVLKYRIYDSNLVTIDDSFVGFPKLINSIYNTIDFKLLLEHNLMPSANMIDTTAVQELVKLNEYRLSPIVVTSVETAQKQTVDNAVLLFAKAQVNRNYQVKIVNSTYSSRIWSGSFIVTNYYDEEDTATTQNISISIVGMNDNREEYVRQVVEKHLAQLDSDGIDIVSLFSLSDSAFSDELKKYSAERLNSFRESCNACINVLIENGAGTTIWNETNGDLYNALYIPYKNKLQIIDSELNIRNQEIEVIDDMQTNLIRQRNEVQSTLNLENYLGTDLWKKFNSYRRDDTYSNSNYISDGLTNSELFDNARQFIDAAKKEIFKSATMQHSISASLKNLLVMREFQPLLDNFELGNFIHIDCDGKIFDLRMIKYEINFDNLENIVIEFSDVKDAEDTYVDAESIVKQVSSMTSTYDFVTRQANKGESSRSQLDGWNEKGLSLTNIKIVGSADNQEYEFDSHGMLFRKYLPLSGTFDDRQLKIINSTIAITNDSWDTVKTAIGMHYFVDPLTNEIKEGYGINGEVIIGKILLGEELGIYNSGSTLRFTKNGLYVSNNIYTLTANPNDESKLFAITRNADDVDILNVSANGLSITGEVNATSGNIGGCSIIGGVLKISEANIDGTLSANKIKGGSIDATDVTISNLTVDAAQITGELTFSQLPSDTAKTNDIPSSISDLNVTPAQIIGYINENGNSALKIFANNIDLTGYVTITGLSGGTTTIDGACIKTGTISGDYISGSTLSITTGSTIATWNIDNNSIYNGTWVSDGNEPSNLVFMSTGTTGQIKIGERTGSNWVFGAGSKFGVTRNGDLYATSATISGIVDAKEGKIANFDISQNNLVITPNSSLKFSFHPYTWQNSITTRSLSFSFTYAAKRKIVIKYVVYSATSTNGGGFVGNVDSLKTIILNKGSSGTKTETIDLNSITSFYSVFSTSTSLQNIGLYMSTSNFYKSSVTMSDITNTSLFSNLGQFGTFQNNSTYNITFNSGKFIALACNNTSSSDYGKFICFQIETEFLQYDSGYIKGGISYGEKASIHDDVEGLFLSTNGFGIGENGYYFNDRGYIYCNYIMQESSSGTGSDRNIKNSITPLDERYDMVFDNLSPKLFKYNNGTSGRFHLGFIAQDVKDAIESAGLTTNDYASYVETTSLYGDIVRALRYEEFIALNTWQIQKLKTEVTELKTQINLLKGE